MYKVLDRFLTDWHAIDQFSTFPEAAQHALRVSMRSGQPTRIAAPGALYQTVRSQFGEWEVKQLDVS